MARKHNTGMTAGQILRRGAARRYARQVQEDREIEGQPVEATPAAYVRENRGIRAGVLAVLILTALCAAATVVAAIAAN